MSDTPATPPPPPLVADRLTDFGDRLPPMLVKELRQGLRARTFVTVFLALQILLAIVLLSATGSTSPQQAGRVISSVIFFFFSLAVLIVQPLRGVGALHSEIKDNTLEMMVLTRLSAWRIVLGKWSAIVGQSALLLAAIAPYLILRYWFGDMNLLGELMLLLLIFVASATATAITVGFSAIPSVIIRGLLPLFGAIVLTFFMTALAFGRELAQLVDACALQTSDSRWAVLIFLIAALYLAWTALGLATSMIAPAAENHATARRLLTLGLLIALNLISLGTPLEEEVLFLLAVIFCVPALAMTLSEPFTLLPPVVQPFVRRGALGRLAGRLLYPGWPAGSVFAVAVVALGLSLLLLTTDELRDRAEETTLCLTLFGSLIFPAVLIGFFHHRVHNRFAVYILILVGAGVLTFLLGLMAEAMGPGSRGFLWFFVWLPPINMLIPEVGGSRADDAALLAAYTLTGVYLLLMLLHALRLFPEIRRVEETAIEGAEAISAAPEPIEPASDGS